MFYSLRAPVFGHRIPVESSECARQRAHMIAARVSLPAETFLSLPKADAFERSRVMKPAFLIFTPALMCSCATTVSPTPATDSGKPRLLNPPSMSTSLAVATPARPSEPVSASGVSLSVAQARAINLEPGLPLSAVRESLGLPDETSSGTFGQATSQPWIGMTWNYIWKSGYTTKRLEVVFSKSAGNWTVNHWDWRNY